MLNEALESGKIPQNDTNKEPEDTVVEPVETTVSSGSYILNDDFDNRNHRIFKKKRQIPTGEVIKLHKYTYNMQFPPQIQNALNTLDIVYPFTQKDISAAYHKKLKETHPDTKNTIHNSNNVYNFRQLSIDEIKNSYQILCDFFGIK
jgi:hypothetical protein